MIRSTAARVFESGQFIQVLTHPTVPALVPLGVLGADVWAAPAAPNEPTALIADACRFRVANSRGVLQTDFRVAQAGRTVYDALRSSATRGETRP